MPPGPGVKPVSILASNLSRVITLILTFDWFQEAGSPWGQPHPGARGWGETDTGASTGGWGGGLEADSKRPQGDAGMWGQGDKSTWGQGGGGQRGQQMPGIRSSPSWEDGPGGPGMMGDRGQGWGGAGARSQGVSKEIWGSKQFRILCEMGFRKEDVETALRNTNMQLDDALELLNALNRGGMPGGGSRGMPPGDGFGPRGEPDYGMRFPGPGPMPYPPGGAGDIPGVTPSRPGSLQPSLAGMNGGPGMHGAPPRSQPQQVSCHETVNTCYSAVAKLLLSCY